MSETVELRHGKGDVDHELDFSSTDSCPELMQYFLDQLGLPAPDEFVCLSVPTRGQRESALGCLRDAISTEDPNILKRSGLFAQATS